MHVLAGADVLAGKADDLAVAPHRFATGDRAGGDLVAGRDQADHGHAFVGERRAGHHLVAGNDHVVIGMQPDGARRAGKLRGGGDNALCAHGVVSRG